MSAFIHGTQTVGISGGNFRQTSYNEQHEHQTRVFREDKTIIQGNIYGYTHSAVSDDGPIIAYSHTTNIARPYDDDGNSGQSWSLPRVKGQTHSLPPNDTPLLGDSTEQQELTDERRPVFLLTDTQHQTSEPFSYPDLDDQKLKAEFHTMSPEMQRYVTYMLGQLEKRTASSGNAKKPMNNMVPVTRGSTGGMADQKPIGFHSDTSFREPHHIADSIPNNPITTSPQIDSHSSGHGALETQSLSGAKPSTAIKTQENRFSSANYSNGVAPAVAPKRSLIRSLIRKARSLSKVFIRPVKSR